MALGTEVCLSAGNIVFDGDPDPLFKKRHSTPAFRPMSIVTKRLDGSQIPVGLEVDLCPCHVVLYGDQSSPPQRGTAVP